MNSDSEMKIMDFVLAAMNMKSKMARKVKTNTFNKSPAIIPVSLQKRTTLILHEIDGRKVWHLNPKEVADSDWVVLFLHGGAFYSNITQGHWCLIDKLIQLSSASFVVPDYPLAPENSCIDVIAFLEKLYSLIINEFTDRKIAIIGDSAGGGLALSLSMKLQSVNMLQPQKIILFSPWVDVTMSNPDIKNFDMADKILSIDGLREAGQQYAGSLSLTDYRVSPLYGDCKLQAEISIFIGTHDLLLPDAKILRDKLKAQCIKVNYFEYPGMCHDWVLITQLPSSKDALQKVQKILKSDDILG